MPELPEVETVARGLAQVWEGQTFTRINVHRSRLRNDLPPDFAAQLTGQTIQKVGRRAKYLVVETTGPTLLGHLGMSGRMIITQGRNTPPAKHDHLEFFTDNGFCVTYCDPRRFGMMDLSPKGQEAAHPFFAKMGPEPFDPAFTPQVLAKGLKSRKSPIKIMLLDQSLVAGLGNIYVSESLFRAKISPLRPAGSLSLAEISLLHQEIRAVLTDAIAAGGSTLKDHRQPSGELGYFQHAFKVYDRQGQPCPDCECDLSQTKGIARIVQGGRSTFYCAKKQL